MARETFDIVGLTIIKIQRLTKLKKTDRVMRKELRSELNTLVQHQLQVQKQRVQRLEEEVKKFREVKKLLKD